MTAEVYYLPARQPGQKSILEKMERLFDAAGFKQLFDPGDLVAIKCHFGEPGNMAYLRPNFVRTIVDKVKENKGRPFLTDCNTLYKGARGNAPEHIFAALQNGFGPEVTGAPIIIADGLTGLDYVEVEVGLKHFKKVKIGSAVHRADSMIVATHFKGHGVIAMGGALKNVAMGCGSRAAKQQMHSDIKPKVEPHLCNGDMRCIKFCPSDAITMVDQAEKKVAEINSEKCIGCGECVVVCPTGAIGIRWAGATDAMQEKIAEYAFGVVKEKPGKVGYFNFLYDISPDCDCWDYNDSPLVENLGILAATDPVAIDQASADLFNEAPAIKNSALKGKTDAKDKFKVLYPNVDWEIQLRYAEHLGLGERSYRLTRLQ